MPATRSPAPLQSQINITPLVDVCLVILLIFMVVMPYLVPGRGVQLADARNPEPVPEANDAVTLSVEAGGALYIENRAVGTGEVDEALRRAHDSDPGRPVRLQADRRVAFRDVKGVLRAAEAAGFRKIVLVVRPVDRQGRPLPGQPLTAVQSMEVSHGH